MNDLVGFLVCAVLVATGIGVARILHAPGACYVGKAAVYLGNPC